MIYDFADIRDKVVSVQCGMGHTIAITQKGCVFSWGEGSEGKLGHGMSKKTRLIKNIDYPKKIEKGLP
jgi:alpha-tubulin suppressor-like RCC1 family protein